MSEEEKAERRTVIANNKAWDSATTVRRKWLTTLAQRKALPKDAARAIAALLVNQEPDLTRAGELACTFLDLTIPDSYHGARSALQQAVEADRAKWAHHPGDPAGHLRGTHRPPHLAPPEPPGPPLLRHPGRMGLRPLRGRTARADRREDGLTPVRTVPPLALVRREGALPYPGPGPENARAAAGPRAGSAPHLRVGEGRRPPATGPRAGK